MPAKPPIGVDPDVVGLREDTRGGGERQASASNRRGEAVNW